MWLLGLHKKPEGNVVENVGASPGSPPPRARRRPPCSRPAQRPHAYVAAPVQQRETEEDVLHAPPVLQAKTLSPLAVVHTLGNMLTNISLGAVAVSFTHTIKALEPMFSGAGAAPRCWHRPPAEGSPGSAARSAQTGRCSRGLARPRVSTRQLAVPRAAALGGVGSFPGGASQRGAPQPPAPAPVPGRPAAPAFGDGTLG